MSMKYKLMVVDDENLAIESVKYIVEKEISNIEVSEIAKSGREAIEKARQQRPDIVLMDIRMPGINGLEAIKEIKKIHKNVRFIIVSAYEYFDFAKQAVELGVSDYITKPVTKQQLVETLEEVTKELDDERRKQDQELETKEKIEKMQAVVEHSFIYTFMLGQAGRVDFKRYKELFEITSEVGYIFILQVQSRKDTGGEMRLEESFKNQSFYPMLRDELKFNSKCVVGPLVIDRVVVYMSEKSDDEYKRRVEAIDFLEWLVDKLENKFHICLKVGIGGAKADEDIAISYQEAVRALNFDDGEKITHIADVTQHNPQTGYEIFADEQKLIQAIEQGDTGRCVGILTDIFNRYPDFFERENIRTRLIEVMVVAHRIAMENGIDSDQYIEYCEYTKQILNCTNKVDFERLCVEKISYIATKINQVKKHGISVIVDKANEIIRERFNTELTLDEISREMGVSPQYFSRLFKAETGKNFIDHLTDIRIEHAKKLIEKGELSIKEISYASGYSDPNYFSRLFKKKEGISPSTYFQKF